MLYVKGFLVALQGVPVTVGVTLIAMVTGVVLGLVLALMKMSGIKVLTALASSYIEIIRGTPLIVQALILGIRSAAAAAVQRNFLPVAVPHHSAIIVCGLNSARMWLKSSAAAFRRWIRARWRPPGLSV